MEVKSYVCRSYRGKTGKGSPFWHPSILNRIKIKVFWKKLWRHNFCSWRHQQNSNTWGVIMLSKFGNSRILWEKLYKLDFIKISSFFSGCSWFKLNILGMAPDMDLKFCTSFCKWVKTKNQAVFGCNSYVCRIYRVASEGGCFLPPTSWIGLEFRMHFLLIQ